MGFSLGDMLTNQGMNQESARFVEACVTAGSAQDFKLVQMGFSPPLAIELARQINAFTFRADYLINLGMPFPQARALVEGGGVSAYAPYRAPSGYHWEFVTDGGVTVTDAGVPVVDLVGN